MKAYSTQTERTYDSWEDLVAEEANGYGVVVLGRSTTKRRPGTRPRPFAAPGNAPRTATPVSSCWASRSSPSGPTCASAPGTET